MKKRYIPFIILFESLYCYHINLAQTWSSVKRLTWTTTRSLRPVIVTDSNRNPLVIWHDKTSGNYEIYYKNRK